MNIIHIQGTLGSTAQIGRTGALDSAANRYNNWNILTRLDGDFTQAKSYEVMSEYLDSVDSAQRIDVVYCENDNEAFGAIQALEERGYVCGENVNIITFDATRKALELCMEGRISLVVECNPLLGELVEEIIRSLEAGEIPEKHQYVDEQCFTPETVTAQLIAQRAY